MKPDEAKKYSAYPDSVVFRVAELFIGGEHTVQEIALKVNGEIAEGGLSGSPSLSRETVYPLMTVALQRKFFRLLPPSNEELAKRLSAKYPSLVPQYVRVVETAGRRDNAKVARVAAETALELIREIALVRQASPIGIGLGPGRATLDFCQHFSQLLASEPSIAKLKLVGISAGGPPRTPEYTSTSFFNLFPRHLVEEQIGLFAETLVPSKEFPIIQKRTGLKEAFEARKDIDLVVTAMGDIHDEHDLLTMFLKDSNVDLEKLKAEGWIGNVQYRPYSADGPIKEKPNELRAVTLFELEDLVKMADQKAKHVLLIARQCGLCRRNRADAIRPLLTNPKLRVFSRLVLDAATAVDLLKDPQSS